jgi:hypothetical protein
VSTELVYRMRTCAAAILSSKDSEARVVVDAAELLIEASNLLDTPEEPGEPMEIITSVGGIDRKPSAVWGADLPAAVPQPCPSCGSIDARTARRAGRQLMLTCPRCAATWEYGK